jgi:hypothetical protein
VEIRFQVFLCASQGKFLTLNGGGKQEKYAAAAKFSSLAITEIRCYILLL